MIGVLTLVLASIPASVAIGAQGSYEGSYCFPPDERARNHTEQLVRNAETFGDARLTAALTEEEFEPLDESKDRAVCKRLNELLVDAHTSTRTRDDGQERHDYDVSYFRLGDLYVILMLPRALRDREDMQALSEEARALAITTTGTAFVQFRDENLEVLGNFDTLGRSTD